jgi:drug/metabolite transporter (DMT)-like permease
VQDFARLRSGEFFTFGLGFKLSPCNKRRNSSTRNSACAIGAAYALIITGLGSLLGKEAAGLAGVALTALATTIFKQFETLRFKTIAEHEERRVSIPRLNIPYLLLLVFAFQGIQFLGECLSGVIAGSFGWFKDVTSSDYSFLVLIGGVGAVSYFAGGYLWGRTAPRVSFSYALIGSILSLVVGMILQVIAVGWRLRSLSAQR